MILDLSLLFGIKSKIMTDDLYLRKPDTREPGRFGRIRSTTWPMRNLILRPAASRRQWICRVGQ